MKEKRKQVFMFAICSAVLIVLDQWTKSLAVAHLKGQSPLVLLTRSIRTFILKTVALHSAFFRENRDFCF